jgi:hypothetical protein
MAAPVLTAELSMRFSASILAVYLSLAACVAPGLADGPDRPATGLIHVRFTDGSTLKLALKDAKIDVATPYGRLSVPVGDIRQIEFATRLGEDATKRIEEAMPNLAHSQFAKREAASAELLKLREKAYPALLEAARHKDPEVARRANELLDRIRELVPAEHLEVRKFDVLQTADSKFSGRIEVPALKALSAQFGDVQLKLSDIRSLAVPGAAEDEPVVAHADVDPGSLIGYQDKLGKTFWFRITGAVTGSLWGTDVYTADSALASSAVHAGILKTGETGVVKVTMMASPPTFAGSTRNGVTSMAYGPFVAAYKVSR